MYYVYVLRSKFNGEIYIGSTNELERRLEEHNGGKVFSTKRYKPWKLIYYEAYMKEELARKRERRLKQNGNANRELKKRIGWFDSKSRKEVYPTPLLKLKSGAGFTLVELLVYVSVLAVTSGLMVGILSTLLRVQNQATSSQEVSEQSQFVLQTIQRNIRDASAIIVKTSSSTTPLDNDASPAEGAVLRLKMKTVTRGTVTIYLSGTTVKIAERNDSTLAETSSDLTNSRVTVDSLSFKKRTNPPGHDTVLVSMTMHYNSSNSQLAVSRTFQSAISRVSAAVFDSDIKPADDTGGTNVGASTLRWGSGYFKDVYVVGTTASNGKRFQLRDGSAATNVFDIYDTASTTSRFAIDNGGNIGVGTSTPATLFSVATSTNIFNVLSSGFVGIGTSTPVTSLHIKRDANDALSGLFIENSSTGSSARPQLAIGEDELFKGMLLYYSPSGASASSTAVLTSLANAVNGIQLNAQGTSAPIKFLTGGSATPKMIIDSSGNVGIGISTPGNLLDIQGGYQFSTANVNVNAGTLFPGSPASGDRFLRTDRNIWYYFDGTRWLSEELFTTTMARYSNLNPATGLLTDVLAPFPWDGGSNAGIFVINWALTYFLATNNSTNFYTFNLSNGATNVDSFNTSGLAINTWFKTTRTLNSVWTESASPYISVNQVPTGTPGSAYTAVLFTYRLIGQ